MAQTTSGRVKLVAEIAPALKRQVDHKAAKLNITRRAAIEAALTAYVTGSDK